MFGDGLWETLMKRNSNVPMFDNKCLRCKQPCFHLTYLAGQGSATPSGYMSDFSLSRSRRDELPNLFPIDSTNNLTVNSKATSNSESSSPERVSTNPTHTGVHLSYKAAISATSQDKKSDKVASIPSIKVARVTPEQGKTPLPIRSPSVKKPGDKALPSPTDRNAAPSASPTKSKAVNPASKAVSTSSAISKTDKQTNSVPDKTNLEMINSITVGPVYSSATDTTNESPTHTGGDEPSFNASSNALSVISPDSIVNGKQTIQKDSFVHKGTPIQAIKGTVSAFTNRPETSTTKNTSKNAKKAISVPVTVAVVTPKQITQNRDISIVPPPTSAKEKSMKETAAASTSSSSTLSKKDPKMMKKKNQLPVDRSIAENNALGAQNRHSDQQIEHATKTKATTASTNDSSSKVSKKKAKKKVDSSTERPSRLGQGALLGFLLLAIASICIYYAYSSFYFFKDVI